MRQVPPFDRPITGSSHPTRHRHDLLALSVKPIEPGIAERIMYLRLPAKRPPTSRR
jgi:hypothetical protein